MKHRNMDFLLPWLVLCLVVMPGTVEPSYDPEEKARMRTKLVHRTARLLAWVSRFGALLSLDFIRWCVSVLSKPV